MQLGHEPTPYKKKRGKRPPKKANHKHVYEPVIGVLKDSTSIPLPSKRCKICGKTQIVNTYYYEEVDGNPRFHRMMDLEEVTKKYPKLEIVEVEF